MSVSTGEIFQNANVLQTQPLKLDADLFDMLNADQCDGTDFLKAQLIEFFSIKENLDRILPIINRTSPVSLRVLNHFVVYYSRHNPTKYILNGNWFDVQESYQDRLEKFSKKSFDPFRRNRNSRFFYTFGKERLETTVGQLCFFRWCIQCQILEYVEKNLGMISEDMRRRDVQDELRRLPFGQNGATSQGNTGDRTQPKRRQSSRRKSIMTVTATRAPSKGDNVKFVVAFD